MTTKATETRYPDIAGRIERFSDWFRAKRAVAICIKYVRRLKNRVNKSKEETCEVSVNDLEAAGTLIIRSFQASASREEIDTLKRNEHTQAKENKENLKFHSAIYKLDPFIDNEGTLRVGGRLKNVDLPSPIKHPVILPRGSHVSSLIITHFHERVGHQGKGITLNEVRANGYWIIGGISAVNGAISSCFKCRKLRAPVVKQKMSDLPEDRLECHPPFTYCAVDYFGPFTIKENRKELKRYGVLFTCMASRAIHCNLIGNGFLPERIKAFSQPQRTRTSNTLRPRTNFVGARRELIEALVERDHNRVKVELQRSHCDWTDFKMNVPAASHMGGVWERQIRTVRSVLFSLLASNGRQLDDESLRTLMCEVESIVNSRPLTVNQLTDPDSPVPLTPNHLLTMKSKVLLAPPGTFEPADIYARKRWRRVQHLANEFWMRWRKEFLLALQERQKWSRPRRNLTINDIVLVKDENTARSMWQLARVVAVYPSRDGQVRKVQVALADSCLDNKGKRTGATRYLERPVQKLVLLASACE